MSLAATHWSFCCRRIAIDTASSRLTARSVGGDSSMLVKVIGEIAVRHGQTDTVQCAPRHRPFEEFAADGGKHRVGENGVDHAPAALDLGAPAHDQLNGLIIVFERDAVMVDHSLRNSSELQVDDVRE